jgi:histidinol-phosphate/aromatic aminotransferase/cobyric acid decarboxylase-like protein
MPSPIFPKAYLITFTTYGTRLPGNPRGWIDRRQNKYGTPFPPAQQCLETEIETHLRYPPYELDALRRSLVLAAI